MKSSSRGEVRVLMDPSQHKCQYRKLFCEEEEERVNSPNPSEIHSEGEDTVEDLIKWVMKYYNHIKRPTFNKHCRARPCKWPQPYDPDFGFSMSHLFCICHLSTHRKVQRWRKILRENPNFFMAHTEQMWHGETKIWVVRSRSFTWTSPAMLVKVYGLNPIACHGLMLCLLVCKSLKLKLSEMLLLGFRNTHLSYHKP